MKSNTLCESFAVGQGSVQQTQVKDGDTEQSGDVLKHPLLVFHVCPRSAY